MAMWRNPYSQSEQDEPERPPYTRDQLLGALGEEPAPPVARPRPVTRQVAVRGAAPPAQYRKGEPDGPVPEGVGQAEGSYRGAVRGAAPPATLGGPVDFTDPANVGQPEGGYWTGGPEPRTKVPPQGDRSRLTLPGYQTSFNDPARTAELTRNAYGGEPPETEPPPATPAPTSPTSGRTVPIDPATGKAILDYFDDPYQRRGKADRGATDAIGGALGSAGLSIAMTGVGAPIGGAIAAVGGLMKLFGRTAKTAKTDFYQEDAREILKTFTREASGREASEAEIEELLKSQGWEPGDRWVGEKGLSEVLNRLAVQFAEEQGVPPEEAPAVGAEAAAAVSAPAGGPLGQYSGNLEGFNMGRFEDPSGQGNNTIKYQVGRVLSKHAPNAEGLAAAAEELRAMGMDVQQAGSKGDLLVFGDEVVDDNGNAIGTIDVGRGFGASGSGWAWQPQGGAGAAGGDGGGGFQGSGATNLQDAFGALQGMVGPDASIEEMESAIAVAFGEVPGFEDAYKESVKINGQWYDLVGSYGGANPTWQLMPKNDGGGAAARGGVNTAPGLTDLSALTPGVELAAPLGQSDVNKQIQAALQRLISGAPDRDALLAALGG